MILPILFLSHKEGITKICDIGELIMKKVLLCCLILFGLGVLAFAGGGSDAGNSGVTTLTLRHIWASDTESSKAPFEKVLADFAKDHPEIRLVVDTVENEAHKQTMPTVVQAGEAPDIYFWWSGGFMKPFVDAGALLPLNDYLDAATRSKLVSGSTDNMTFDGKIYGLPYGMNVGTFFVNEELFSANGLKVPATWNELLEVCRAFQAKGITPLAVGAKEAWTIHMYTDLIGVRQAGAQASIAALNKSGSFNTPDMIEAFRKLQQLVDTGAFGQGALGISRDESEVPFYEGKVPMYVNGSWTIGNIGRTAVADKVKIYPFPTIGSNSTINDFTGGAAEMFVINSKTKNKDAAVTALKYICEHMAAEAYLAGVGLPTWNVQVDASRIDPLTRSLVDLTKNATSFVLWWNTYLGGADSTLWDQTDQALFAKQLTPEQAAAQMATIR
jgi:raffinose/stachyose/melibiose transport system substrate-binding protein